MIRVRSLGISFRMAWLESGLWEGHTGGSCNWVGLYMSATTEIAVSMHVS